MVTEWKTDNRRKNVLEAQGMKRRMHLVDIWNGKESQWGKEIPKGTSRSWESFLTDASRIMLRDQEKANVMCQRVSGCMVYRKEWSSCTCSGKFLEYVKTNHGNFKQPHIMHNPMERRVLYWKTRFTLLEMDARESIKRIKNNPLDCFQFGAAMNNTVMDIYKIIFMCSYLLTSLG